MGEERIEFLTVKQLADRMMVKQVTVYKWLREKRLEGLYKKIGGTYRFYKDKIDKWVANR